MSNAIGVRVAPMPRPWASWFNLPAYLLVWSIPGVAALSFYYLNQTVTAAPLNWSYALVSTLPNWYIWALLTPVIVRICRSWPLEQETWKRVVFSVHVPALLASMLIHSAVNLILFRTAGLHDQVTIGLYQVHFFTRIHANIFTYAAIVGLYSAWEYYRRYMSREAQTAVLQVQLAQANLRALKMQIHPHFLFNTLHSIAALVRKGENKPAVNMLGQLGEFLRLALENKGQQEIQLEQELDFLRRYLAIEKTRFGDRLTVDIQCDSEAAHAFVPNLILQPIVENAIHHGISPSMTKGVIRIVARAEAGRLCMTVADNGPGLKNPDRLRKGVGVGNTQERLENLYGKDQEFSLRNGELGGLEVRICIPFMPQPIIQLPADVA
ncbi:MAG: histidine kinase [Bacteroidetes bacterium]|nr:histidine kinase [Bacteroidota bacterium]